MKIALSKAPVSDEVKVTKAGLFTFFQEIRNLLLTKLSDCRNVSIMSKKRKNIICKDIGICIRAEGIVSYAHLHIGPSVPGFLRARR